MNRMNFLGYICHISGIIIGRFFPFDTVTMQFTTENLEALIQQLSFPHPHISSGNRMITVSTCWVLSTNESEK